MPKVWDVSSLALALEWALVASGARVAADGRGAECADRDGNLLLAASRYGAREGAGGCREGRHGVLGSQLVARVVVRSFSRELLMRC